MTPKQRTILYWTTTGLFCALLTFSGVMSLLGGPDVDAGMRHLGYPMYFVKWLGFWKLVGVATILANRTPRLKEWAYAGFTIDLLTAAISYLGVGDGAKEFLLPLVAWGFLMTSYYCWRQTPPAASVMTPMRRAA